MSPPSIFACYAYNNGGCALTEDECLFTHAVSDPGSQYLQICHPDLTPRDVPIAEAAANAGFDCGNWAKLKSLIDAVRAVNAPISYPDPWNGPAAFKSSTHPYHWTAAHQKRKNRGVVQAYREVERASPVPAFVVNAAQIIKNINSLPRVRGTEGAPDMRATNSNRIPLGPVTGNKRGGDETTEFLSSSPKRLKNELLVSQPSIIDLTHDDEPVQYNPTPRPRPRQASTNKSKLAGSSVSKGQRKARQRAANNQMSRESVGIPAQIASKLRASAHALDVDRDTLRQQWDADEELQLQTVTDHLVQLNECFGRAADGIQGALDVIEKRLL